MNTYVRERETLLQSIEHDQEDLHQALDELKNAAQQAIDLGAYIAERPTPWLVGAFVLGLWLGVRHGFAAEAD